MTQEFLENKVSIMITFKSTNLKDVSPKFDEASVGKGTFETHEFSVKSIRLSISCPGK